MTMAKRIEAKRKKRRANARQSLDWRKEFERNEAANTLRAIGIELGVDFHTLPSNVVARLLLAADAQRYRQRKPANGSRARYFHDRLQRRAAR